MMGRAIEPSGLLGHGCTCNGLRRGENSKWPPWVNDASGADCGEDSIAWEVVWVEAHMSSRCSDPSCQFIDKSLRNELSMQMAGSNVLDETDWTHCSDPSARLGLCSHTPGAQVVADM